jgi:putative membrane protein
MMKVLGDWIVNAFALFIVSRIVSGIQLQNFQSALVAVIIIGLINALIKPILVILTLPITIVTLGLFALVLNALLLLLAGSITPGFKVDGFWAACIGSILLSVVSTLLHSLVRTK